MTDVFEVTGETGFNSTMTAILARVVFLQGRIDEAERLVERSRQLTAEDDVATQNAWRLASALVHSSHGAHDEAIRLAREAIEIMEATDYLAWNALSHETLGEVLANAGRTDEARAEFHEALTRYTDKGVRPSVERVESHLAAL
jgi:Flp pilus assembly protein TadD